MTINNGDTAFMMLATAMVCLMTPGLAFFYGGLARKRNVLYMMLQSFISMGIITMLWIFGGSKNISKNFLKHLNNWG